MTALHNHTPSEECGHLCPVALQAVFAGDQAEAVSEATAREAEGYRLAVAEREATVFHNNTLGALHLARAHAQDAVAEVLPPLALATVLFALGYAVRGFRR